MRSNNPYIGTIEIMDAKHFRKEANCAPGTGTSFVLVSVDFTADQESL